MKLYRVCVIVMLYFFISGCSHILVMKDEKHYKVKETIAEKYDLSVGIVKSPDNIAKAVPRGYMFLLFGCAEDNYYVDYSILPSLLQSKLSGIFKKVDVIDYSSEKAKYDLVIEYKYKFREKNVSMTGNAKYPEENCVYARYNNTAVLTLTAFNNKDEIITQVTKTASINELNNSFFIFEFINLNTLGLFPLYAPIASHLNADKYESGYNLIFELAASEALNSLVNSISFKSFALTTNKKNDYNIYKKIGNGSIKKDIEISLGNSNPLFFSTISASINNDCIGLSRYPINSIYAKDTNTTICKSPEEFFAEDILRIIHLADKELVEIENNDLTDSLPATSPTKLTIGIGKISEENTKVIESFEVFQNLRAYDDLTRKYDIKHVDHYSEADISLNGMYKSNTIRNGDSLTIDKNYQLNLIDNNKKLKSKIAYECKEYYNRSYNNIVLEKSDCVDILKEELLRYQNVVQKTN